MALTEQQIFEAIAPFYAEHHVARSAAEMCMDEYRAVEAAAVAPLLECIAALEAQVEQAAQPVAWMDRDILAKMQERCRFPDDSIWPVRGGISSWTPDSVKDNLVPIYTAPPKAVPLTDEQIDGMWKAPMSADWEHREFARAVEQAHGITPATAEKG